MYNLEEAVCNATANNTLTQQQLKKLNEHSQYLKKHKIHELCNQMLAKIIETRPEKVKEQMVNVLQKIKDKQYYYRKPDFQTIFDGYDIFGTHGNGQISYVYLLQTLNNLNIYYSQQQFLNKYPQFKLQKSVKRADFVNITEGQYKKKIQK